MIQFDGHIFLDGLNAPTRWCFVLDFLKKASPAPRYVCWRNPAWHSKWKGFHKNTHQILSSIRKAFGTSHAARFVQSWIHGKMIQLETKLTWTLFFYFDGRSTTCFYHWMNIGVSGNSNLMCQLRKLVLGRENEGNCRYLQLIARWGVMNIAIVDVSETLLNQFILDYLQKRFFTPLGCIKPRK